MMTTWNRMQAWCFRRIASFCEARVEALAPDAQLLGNPEPEMAVHSQGSSEIWSVLCADLSRCLDTFMNSEEGPELLVRIQVVFEVLAYKLGVADGVACLAGIPAQVRNDARFQWNRLLGEKRRVNLSEMYLGTMHSLCLRILEVYAHLVEERTGHTVSKMHLYYTGEESGNPYVTFPKKQDSIERTISAFDEIVGRIEARDFAMGERPAKLCKQCDMKPYCDAK